MTILPENTLDLDEAVQRGVQALRDKRFADALAPLAAVVEAEPQNSLVWYRLGICLMRLGDADKAMLCLENALYWNSGLLEALDVFSSLKAGAGDERTALSCRSRAWLLKPHRHDLEVDLPVAEKPSPQGARQRLTLIIHIYNEAYLLPFWIAHHRHLVDHVVFIDYHSTDATVDICRDMAPQWEVVTSRNARFEAREVDYEVMEIERRIEGWKLSLNVTEFLYADREALDHVMEEEHRAYALRGMVMACPDDKVGLEADAGRSLIDQFPWGRFEDEYCAANDTIALRNRILHNYPDGNYTPGRHLSLHEVALYPDRLAVLWYGFSPWNDAAIKRKSQIGARVPSSDLREGMGAYHLAGADALNHKRHLAAQNVEDVRGLLKAPTPTALDGRKLPSAAFRLHNISLS